ncbi:GlxA family transcriptional regulator [Tabrizicola sp.]|uniref:GlxA family transcriptional regulator n=1 Tax=Tabrizicola sp. TaxID=2005166 RepID=UPI003F3B11E4
MIAPPAASRRIALLAFDGVQSLDVSGPLEVFATANELSGSQPYELVFATPDGRPITVNAGLVFAAGAAFGDLPADLDTIIVTGGSEAALLAAATDRVLVDDLRAVARRCRRVASVCVGAFVLAGAGLLDGRRATTHWNRAALLAALFPKVKVEPDAIFVVDPPFFTSGGVTAGIDLCLALVEADCGADLARKVAKQMLLFMRRPGGQSQFSRSIEVQMGAAPRIRALVAHILEYPDADLGAAALAAKAGMSERSLLRAFRRELGQTPAAFVEASRLDRAKALLESSDWPLARVAERSGFGSLASLHRAFVRRVGVAPGFYRERFRSAG